MADLKNACTSLQRCKGEGERLETSCVGFWAFFLSHPSLYIFISLSLENKSEFPLGVAPDTQNIPMHRYLRALEKRKERFYDWLAHRQSDVD